MAINDIVESTAHWKPEKVNELNLKLIEQDAFTLSDVRRLYSKKYLRILKSGKIKNEVEYFFIKGVLDGGVYEDIAEGGILENLLTTFEGQFKV